MIRQSFLGLFLLLLAAPVRGEEPADLRTIRNAYQKIAHPHEAERQRYLMDLVAIRTRYADEGNEAWQAVDAEVRRHPAPKDSNSKILSGLRIGKWASPRHEYVYRSDGTYIMLPDHPQTTNGRWRIEGNQYISIDSPQQTSSFTIILLNEKHFIFTNGQLVFYEKRLPK